jgi:plastocyanin
MIPPRMSRLPLLALLSLGLLAACVAPAAATTTGPGVQHLHYKMGPIHISPGQNTINLAPTNLKPKVPGYITSFRPNITYANGKVPRVDVIHLHHGVWLLGGQLLTAVGEEKTYVSLPKYFGYHYTPDEKLLVNYMLHNLTPNPDVVYIRWNIDFVPDSSPVAKKMHTVQTQWMDVAGVRAYPVFNVHRGSGHNGRLTFPDDDPNNPAIGPANQWIVDRPETLVYTAGHLHPGGLSTFLTVTRAGKTVTIFTSHAHYWDKAGETTWNVSMEATPRNWRVHVLPGDVVRVHAVYDTKRSSWYEVMGIMPLAVENGGFGRDPFTQTIPQKGYLTHGELRENRSIGGAPDTGLPDASKALDGPVTTKQVTIDGFVYGQGDLSLDGMSGRPAVVHQGQTLTFKNGDSSKNIFHTITACKAPCNRSTGIGYPLANGPVDFDSGELGYGPPGFTAAANRDTWTIPSNLPTGTYTYFCRVHPFMRGSFRVSAPKA